METEDLDFLFKYPLLTTYIHHGRKCFKGILPVAGQDVEIKIVEVKSKQNVTYELKTRFSTSINESIKSSMRTGSKDITEYLDNLKSVLEQQLHSQVKNISRTYKKVLYEYSEFTKFHLNIKSCKLRPDLSKIEISTVDGGGRPHNLEILVDFDETCDIFQPVNVDLPEQLCVELSKKSANLTEIYDQFLASIEQLQGLFEVMAEIDGSCCILDPEKPTNKDCHRRIWIDENCSVLVSVDPLDVNSRPDIRFLGSERLIEGFRRNLNEALEKWDNSSGIVQGLLNILGIKTFQFKPHRNNEILTDVGECSICFCLRFNDKLPEVICENKSCEKSYHTQCLYEWLIAVNSKRIFDQIHGQCPNCEKGISCPIPANI